MNEHYDDSETEHVVTGAPKLGPRHMSLTRGTWIKVMDSFEELLRVDNCPSHVAESWSSLRLEAPTAWVNHLLEAPSGRSAEGRVTPHGQP